MPLSCRATPPPHARGTIFAIQAAAAFADDVFSWQMAAQIVILVLACRHAGDRARRRASGTTRRR